MDLAARRLQRLAESGSDTALILWAELSGDAIILSRVGDLQSPLLSLERAALAIRAGVGLPDDARIRDLGALPPGLERCRSDLVSSLGSTAADGNQGQTARRDVSGPVTQSSFGERTAAGEELQGWLTRVQGWREVLGV